MSLALFITLGIVIAAITLVLFSQTNDFKILPTSMLFVISLLSYYIISNHIDVKPSTLTWLGILWILCVILLAIRIFVEWIETIPVDNNDNDDWRM